MRLGWNKLKRLENIVIARLRTRRRYIGTAYIGVRTRRKYIGTTYIGVSALPEEDLIEGRNVGDSASMSIPA